MVVQFYQLTESALLEEPVMDTATFVFTALGTLIAYLSYRVARQSYELAKRHHAK